MSFEKFWNFLETRGTSTSLGININSTRSLFPKLWLFEYMEKRIKYWGCIGMRWSALVYVGMRVDGFGRVWDGVDGWGWCGRVGMRRDGWGWVGGLMDRTDGRMDE